MHEFFMAVATFEKYPVFCLNIKSLDWWSKQSRMKFSTTFTTRQTPLTKSDIIYHHWSIKWHYLEKKKKYQFSGGNIFILVSKRLRKNDEKVNFFSRFKSLINLWNTRKQEGTFFFRKKRCSKWAWKLKS